MRKTLIIAALCIALVGAGAYLYFQGARYTLQFTETELQEKLSAKLPVSRDYLFIFEVVLDNPRLRLVEGSDRVNAGMDVTLNIRIGNEPLPLGGKIDISGGVRYASEIGQFFLTDPIIEDLSVQGVPSRYTDRVDEVMTKALARFYAERPIYTLKDTDVKAKAAKLLLKKVVVRNSVLFVTLGV
ncbi:MAG: DUF1439 domain-containing protein [Pseudomonadota bacterium]